MHVILGSNALFLSTSITFILAMNSFKVTDVALAVAVVISVSIASIVDEEETAEARSYNSYVRGFLRARFRSTHMVRMGTLIDTKYICIFRMKQSPMEELRQVLFTALNTLLAG
jgi:hypothetical protein